MIAALRARRRLFNAGVVVFCLGLLGYALFLQHYRGLDPCPLCLFQRIAVIGAHRGLRAGHAGGRWLASAAHRGFRADRSGGGRRLWRCHPPPLHPVAAAGHGAGLRRHARLHVGCVPRDGRAAQGAHRLGRVRKDRLDLPGPRHAGLGADLAGDPGHTGRAGELARAARPQPSRRRRRFQVHVVQGVDFVQPDRFVDLVDACVGHAQFHHLRAQRGDEPPIRGAAAGAELRRLARDDSLLAAHTPSDSAPGGV